MTDVKSEDNPVTSSEVKNEENSVTASTDTKNEEIPVTAPTTEVKSEEKSVTALTESKSEGPSALEKKIIRQVEYYFGDVNLPKDKFLKEKQVEDDGWITIECLTTFNKLKELSTDLAEICNALKKSTSSLLEINEENFKVRRSKDRPLPDMEDPMVIKAKKRKTLYMKGFPKNFTMDQVSDYLRENGAEPIFVKMRKTDDGNFKGSVFTELDTQEQADKLVENKDLKIEEEPVVIMKRDEYFDKKSQERKAEKNNEKSGENNPNRHKMERKPGSVMQFKNVPEGSSREDVKVLFEQHEKVAWIDFKRGDTEGYIRFENEGAAEKAIAGAKSVGPEGKIKPVYPDGKVMIDAEELEVKVLEGEEEENYYKMTEDEMSRRRSVPKSNFRSRNKRRGGGFDNRYGGKRRRPDNRGKAEE